MATWRLVVVVVFVEWVLLVGLDAGRLTVGVVVTAAGAETPVWVCAVVAELAE